MLVYWNSAAKGLPRFRVHLIPTCERAGGVDSCTDANVRIDLLVHVWAYKWDQGPDGRLYSIGMVCPDCKRRLLEAYGVTERGLLEVKDG